MASQLDARRIAAIDRYAKSIRNPAKRAYAGALVRFMKRGGPAPEKPVALSFMGAQAVELRLAAIWRHELDA